VNPKDERYIHLIGKMLTLPLVGRNIPILADDWAQPEFGTGAVKVTPAHDPNDFAIGQRHNLPSPSIMDPQARIALEGSPYNGLDRFEARKRIVADLEASGHLVAVKDYTLTLPISQRTGAVIEPRLSMQWFLAVNKTPERAGGFSSGAAGQNSIAANAIAAVAEGHITFTPDNNRKTYMEWMTNIHDWCISRQLWWGHRIPAWHCACGEIIVSRSTPTKCPKCAGAQLTQETDVLDTWFSSGLLPFTVFGWDGSNQLTPDLAAFYPTQQLVTGFDILFFWVARMIMLSCHFMLDVPMPGGSPRTLADAVPFRNVYIHALVRDADRQKISKTKGNVIDPIEIVTKYGTDAVRFTLAAQSSPGTDIAFNEARTEGYRAFANKIWNAARFLQMNIDRGRAAGYTVSLNLTTTLGAPGLDSETWVIPPQTPLETRWILSRLHTVAAEVNQSLADYRFDEAANAVYQFFWGEFCDWYLELVKLRLNFGPTEVGAPHLDSEMWAVDTTTALTLNALVSVFEAALRLLSPFMPFLTEELWHALYASVGAEAPAKSIALTHYPAAADFLSAPSGVEAMEMMQELIVRIRSARKEQNVPEKQSVPVFILYTNRSYNIFRANEDYLRKLARVGEIEYVSPDDYSGKYNHLLWRVVGASTSSEIAIDYVPEIDVPAERERLTKDLAKFNKGLEAAEKQLGNEGFLARAPEHIVAGLKKQQAETLALKEKAEAALAALPQA